MFKGTVSRDFRLLFFFMNQFPQAPEYAGGKFVACVVDTGAEPFLAIISANLLKTLKRS
jgi:hypothetical protein